jgi:hypothetical protein
VPYQRVIPRDLFNESKLLKCLAQVALLIHDGKDGGRLNICHRNPSQGFLIDQDPSDGSLRCTNLQCHLLDGQIIDLTTPYNCKSPYPLLYNIGNRDGEVFNDDGSFSDEFQQLLNI